MNVTVLITHFNTPKNLLDRCVNSVIDLGYKYLIIDDCSYTEFLPNLLHYNTVYLNTNIGHFKAFYEGLKYIETDYVLKLDADDYLINKVDTSDAFDCYVNSFNGRVNLDLNHLLERPYAATNWAIVKKELLEKVWETELSNYGDICIFARLLKHGNIKLNNTDNCVYDRRQGNSMTNISILEQKNRINIAIDIIKRENYGL